VGQRTFETRSLYLILAEMLFTLPAANEMLPLSALFAGKYREVGMYLPKRMRAGILLRPTWPSVPPTVSALCGSAEPVLDYLVKIAETHHRDRGMRA
jgi:hypothetical protein